MSPVDNTPPTIRKQPARTDFRLRELERTRVAAQAGAAVTSRPCVFSFPGIVAGGARSGKWKNRNGDSFTLATITCEDAGSSNCDVDILVNGAVLLTVSLGAGVVYAEFAAFFSIGPTDVVQVETTAVGGQTEVTVLIE